MLVLIYFHIVAEKDYTKQADGILINNVQLDQAGKYSCVAIQKLDGLKSIQKREMELIVECELLISCNRTSVVFFFESAPIRITFSENH